MSVKNDQENHRIDVIFDNSNCAPDGNEANFTYMTRNEVGYNMRKEQRW